MKKPLILFVSLFVVLFINAETPADSLSVADKKEKERSSRILRLPGDDGREDGRKLDKAKMEKMDYIPEIHGTIRAKYEYSPTIDAHRFQVRNARFSVTGNVHPIVAYKAEIDLSDEGKIKMLDAYARVFPVNGLSVTLGQMKIPFSTVNLRSPHNYYFANRAFIAKQITGQRDVGLTVGYELKEVFPFSIQGGVFNGTGLTNQTEWQTTMNYAVRAVINPGKWLNVSLNYHSMQPEKLRMNLYDAGVFSEFYGFHIEAEALYKTYRGNAFKPSYGFNSFVNYDLKLPKVFRKISFLARYDMMSDNCDGLLSENNTYEIDDVMRHRVTSGITLSIAAPFIADIRINYEKYFYQNWAHAVRSEQDKFVVEVVARF